MALVRSSAFRDDATTGWERVKAIPASGGNPPGGLQNDRNR